MNRVDDRYVKLESLDGLFDSIFGGGFSRAFGSSSDNINRMCSSGFKSEYYDGGSKAKFTFELAGVNPETISVTVDGKTINLSYVKDKTERKYSIPVDFEPDASKVTATCKFGILTINAEKLQTQSGHPIKINVE